MKTPKVEAILNDRETSDWLRYALNRALERSPVDSYADSLKLVDALEEWSEAKLQNEVSKLHRLRRKVPETSAGVVAA